VHYSLVIMFTGVVVIFACLGLGRFSIGILLPSMGASLDLSYAQMGLIGTGNFVGYMLAVYLAGIVSEAIGARRTISIGLVVVGGSMVLISRAVGFLDVLALYVATGIGSGLANVPMMGLVSHWFDRSTRGRAAGIIISGNGLAIVFAGLLIPWINAALGAEGWRTGWLTIGAISLAVSVVAAVYLRNAPAEKGLGPLGVVDKAATPLKANAVKLPPAKRATMIHLGAIYALFGATYAVYATFIVTAMVNERNFGESAAGSFWAVVGALSIVSGPLFGWLSDRLGRKAGIMMVFTLFTISYGLAAADLPNAFLYASIVIFGLTVWSIPTIMSATVGDYTGPARAVKAFGFITLFFGAGQITGPAVAGLIADKTGTFQMAFGMCALLTAIAVILARFLQPPPQ